MTSKPHLARLLLLAGFVAAMAQLMPAAPVPHLTLSIVTPHLSFAVAL